MPRAITDKDIVGKRYGKLVVLAIDSRRDKANHKYLLCQCDCGKQKSIAMSHLKTGSSRSCGCGVVESTIKRNTTHNGTYSRLYSIWAGMKRRCFNPNDANFKYYGGRGITMAKEWNDFSTFREWSLANGYNDSLTIDRINVNGNYTPDNCRWVDFKFQSCNKTNNRSITIDGETKLISEWCKVASVSCTQVYYRLKQGWNIKNALFLPDQRKAKRKDKHEQAST